MNDAVTIEAVELYQPDLIVAPFLKKAIPEKIWRDRVCIIVHPGIKGDRGPSSLDWAISNGEGEWGVTLLQADAEMDAGDIWSSVNFPMREGSKSSLYRNEVTQAAIAALVETLDRFARNVAPEPLDYSHPDVKGCWCPYMKQAMRRIDWSEPASNIVRKIRAADSQPGLLDEIDGEPYYLYGAWEEDCLKGKPGEIIAQRNGAICRAAGEGAVWISHLKQKRKGERLFCKLPAAMLLGARLKNVPELSIAIQILPNRKTFKEIWYEQRDRVGYLHFEFYNGAMSADQCERLREAFVYARSQPTKAIALMGGHDFWSNGIHLNVIEAAENPADESWRNINAMNDLVREIITTQTHLTIAAMQGNASAGGVMLALACDRVYARSGIVLNPYYKRMNLYGSEYWTYSLPKRIGYEKAMEVTSTCMPMGVRVAKAIGLIDDYFGTDPSSFSQQVTKIAEAIAYSSDCDRQLALKVEQRQRDERIKPLEVYRQEELKQMKIDFYGVDRSYHIARQNFVYKLQPSQLGVVKTS